MSQSRGRDPHTRDRLNITNDAKRASSPSTPPSVTRVRRLSSGSIHQNNQLHASSPASARNRNQPVPQLSRPKARSITQSSPVKRKVAPKSQPLHQPNTHPTHQSHSSSELDSVHPIDNDEIDLLIDALWPRLESRFSQAITRLIDSPSIAQSVSQVADPSNNHSTNQWFEVEGEPGHPGSVESSLKLLMNNVINQTVAQTINQLYSQGWRRPDSADTESSTINSSATRTTHSTPAPCMSFVGHVNLSPQSLVTPSAQLHKVWKVRNTGTEEWPDQLRVIDQSVNQSVDSDKLRVRLETDTVMFSSIKPGDEFNVSVLISTPIEDSISQSGDSLTSQPIKQVFQLAYLNDTHWLPFGEPLPLELLIKPSSKHSTKRSSLQPNDQKCDQSVNSSNHLAVKPNEFALSAPVSPSQSKSTPPSASQPINHSLSQPNARQRSKSDPPDDSSQLINQSSESTIPPPHPSKPVRKATAPVQSNSPLVTQPASQPINQSIISISQPVAAPANQTEDLWSLIPVHAVKSASPKHQPINQQLKQTINQSNMPADLMGSDHGRVTKINTTNDLDWLTHASKSSSSQSASQSVRQTSLTRSKSNGISDTSINSPPSISSPPVPDGDDLMAHAMKFMGDRTTTNRLTGVQTTHPAPIIQSTNPSNPSVNTTTQSSSQNLKPFSSPTSMTRHSLPMSLSMNGLSVSGDQSSSQPINQTISQRQSLGSMPDFKTGLADWMAPPKK